MKTSSTQSIAVENATVEVMAFWNDGTFFQAIISHDGVFSPDMDKGDRMLLDGLSLEQMVSNENSLFTVMSIHVLSTLN